MEPVVVHCLSMHNLIISNRQDHENLVPGLEHLVKIQLPQQMIGRRDHPAGKRSGKDPHRDILAAAADHSHALHKGVINFHYFTSAANGTRSLALLKACRQKVKTYGQQNKKGNKEGFRAFPCPKKCFHGLPGKLRRHDKWSRRP